MGEAKRRRQIQDIISLAVRSVSAFDEPAEGSARVAPSEFRLFRAGVNSTAKGDFVFDAESAASVMAAYTARQTPLMGDYEHMSLAQPPVKAPASITNFVPEVRMDSTGQPELWATQVQWTDTAREHLAAGEYRLYSPAFMPDSEGVRVAYLINVALTNLPATYGLEPLVAASSATSNEESPMDEEKLKELGAKLAQAEKDREEFKGMCQKMSDTVKKLTGKTFDEWAAEESAEHNTDGESEEGAEKEKALKAAEDTKALTALKSKLFALTGKFDVAEALGCVALSVSQSKEFVALKAALETEKAAALETEFAGLVKSATAEGKLSPFNAEFIVGLKADFGTERALAALKKAIPAQAIVQLRAPIDPKTGHGLDSKDMEIARVMGIKPELLQKQYESNLVGR